MNEKKKEFNEGQKPHKVTISVTSGDFPYHKFKEWEAHCINNYNDIRWVKMYEDHIKARVFEALYPVLEKIELLNSINEKVNALEKKLNENKPKEIEESENEIKTLGGYAVFKKKGSEK